MVTIYLDREGVEDFIDPDNALSEAAKARFVNGYADALIRQMQEYNPTHSFCIEWATGLVSGYRIFFEYTDDWGADLSLANELDGDYQAACDKLANFDWLEVQE